MQNKNALILWIICLLWTLFHIAFLPLNEVLKVADSFAYLQMAHYLKDFSEQWLWNGWFGFLYSVPIAFFNAFIENDFLAAKIVNLILLNISWLLIWKLARKYLSNFFSHFTVVLFFLSPTFLHFNIHVLSENIYIPLFLWLILKTLEVIEAYYKEANQKVLFKSQAKNISLLWIIIALMYLTRAEAFIYIWSIWLVSLALLAQRRISLKYFFIMWSVFFLSFFIFISPYLFFLHWLTGEWGLTNKWASNLRQAELRGQDKMDDAGFEQAVAELTLDNHHLIAWFAGGMPYDKPRIDWSLSEYITQDVWWFIQRVSINQGKLWTRNIPEIFLWKSPWLYSSQDSRFWNNIVFLIWSILPLLLLLYGTWKVLVHQKILFGVTLSYLLPACVFFTLFFTLNRYFLIFLPLLLVFYCYGLSHITIKYHRYIQWFFVLNIIWVFLLSALVYVNTEKQKDEYYSLKQDAWTWLHENSEYPESLRILERFPIVTYYSWSKTRYITPYTDEIENIHEYALYNNIDYLVVDSMDFLTYRPALSQYLENTPEGFSRKKEFTNTQWQKVILYEVKK